MLPPHSGSTKSCIWAVLATLRHFGIVLDPEEVVQINSPPHATCYLESILNVLVNLLQGGRLEFLIKLSLVACTDQILLFAGFS